jgi:peptide-methionine (S)-S-oxide reductase
MMASEKIIFGAGCFWGVEATFRGLHGVTNVTCGYAGGHTHHPTYREVCSDETGHAEVVLVEYDFSLISFESLLDTFWGCHNPTTLNRQGADSGSQYRSVIFFYTSQQEVSAKQSREALQQSGQWRDPIVTEILPAPVFYPAEEYHQRYFKKHGLH